MPHARVLLKRDWRTPLGRFAKSVDGEPTEISSRVLKRYPLPSDAETVSADYVAPADREDEDFVSPEMTSAEIEAEIVRRVDEKMEAQEKGVRKSKGKKTADNAEAAAEKQDVDDLLDSSIPTISAALPGMPKEALQDLLAREKGGKTRTGVVIIIEAALEDLTEK